MKSIVYLSEPLVLGLHAIGEIIKNPDKALTTKYIATVLGTNEPHLSKVLQRLRQGRLIKSKQGPGGGYVLNCDPTKVPLTQIFELLLGGAYEPYQCEMLSCKERNCIISQMIDELEQACYRYLAQKNLADFATSYEAGNQVSIEFSVVPHTRNKNLQKI